MLGGVFLKGLRDNVRALLWWSLGLCALVAMECAIYPSVRRSAAGLNQYVNNLPEVFRKAFLGSADFGSPPGFINTELFSIMGPVLLLVFAIGAGARAIAGEEEAGTMDLLLSCPISRRRVTFEKFAFVVTGVGVLSVVLFAALLAGTTAAGMHLGAASLARACLLLGLLGLAFGTLAFAVGAATGRRALAIAVGGGLAAALYLLNTLSALAEGLKPFRVLSLFYYYGGATPLTQSLRAADIAVLLITTAVLLGAALFAFARRDVRT
jgi:ABC-2 type transport system permease protein